MQDTLVQGMMHTYGVLLLHDELWNVHTIIVNVEHISLVIVNLICYVRKDLEQI